MDVQKVCIFIKHLESIVSREHVTHVARLNFSPPRIRLGQRAGVHVTPVNGNSEEVVRNKQHLQGVKQMGGGLNCRDEWKLKVSLYADDIELSSRCHLDRRQKHAKANNKTRLSLKILPSNICSERKQQRHQVNPQ